MEVIGIAVKKVYRFNCPYCGSKLEAGHKELIDIGGKVCTFYCPICKQTRYISWSNIRKKIVYGNPQ